MAAPFTNRENRKRQGVCACAVGERETEIEKIIVNRVCVLDCF